jgi:hypothetical protein
MLFPYPCSATDLPWAPRVVEQPRRVNAVLGTTARQVINQLWRGRFSLYNIILGRVARRIAFLATSDPPAIAEQRVSLGA